MSSNEINLGSSQYKVIMWLRTHDLEWRSNKKISFMMGNKHAFKFSGNDANLANALYALVRMGLVEKRDREIMAQNPYSNCPPRKSWIAEYRVKDLDSIVKTTYLEWESGNPENWHVIQEINGVRRDLGKNW